jgi:hypothetical protein
LNRPAYAQHNSLAVGGFGINFSHGFDKITGVWLGSALAHKSFIPFLNKGSGSHYVVAKFGNARRTKSNYGKNRPGCAKD